MCNTDMLKGSGHAQFVFDSDTHYAGEISVAAGQRTSRETGRKDRRPLPHGGLRQDGEVRGGDFHEFGEHISDHPESRNGPQTDGAA